MASPGTGHGYMQISGFAHLTVSFRNSVWPAFRAVAESDFLNGAANYPPAGNMDVSRLFQQKHLIHANPPAGAIIFAL